MPDYYKSNLNVAVLLAPPATLHNNPDGILRFMSHEIVLQTISSVATKLDLLNWFPYNLFESEATVKFCKLFNGKICDYVISIFTDGDISVDNLSRQDVALSNQPSGAGAYNY